MIRYIVVVAALAVATTTALATSTDGRFGTIDLALAGIALVAVWAPLRLHRGGAIHALTLEDAVLAAYLLGPHPRLAPAVLLGASLIARLVMRPGLAKVAFGPSPVGLGAVVAVAIAEVVGRGPQPLSLRSIGVVVLALAAYNVVSFLVTAELFRRLSGAGWRSLARDSWQASLVTWLGNSAMGLLLAVVAAAEPWGLVLVGVLALGVQVGYRAYARVLGDRNRAEQLARLSRSLVNLTSGSAPVGSWLREVAQLFSGTGATIVAPDGRRFSTGEVPPDVADILADARALGGGIRHGRSGDVLLATVAEGGRTVRLAVWERHGFEPWYEGDAHLLAAIASEAAVALENAQLFQQVERERARWQEESAKLNDILTAASDGIATFSADGQVMSWNPGMAAMTGVETSQANGRPWWTVLRVRDLEGNDLLPEGDHVVTSALAGDRHGDPVSVQVLRRDGQWRWVRATFSPLVSDDGQVDGTVMVARDVTSEHELEELKADFVATVSHELRTPLTPLKGFLATVRQRSDMLTPDQIAMLHESMESQVLRLERLVNDLLVVADLDRGRIRFGRELVGLFDAVELARSEEQEPGEDRVRIIGDRGLAGAADGNAVVRIVRALISNALKHSDGLVTVELAREGHDVTVRVGDEGPGIPPWEQERIFQRFHRLGDHLHRTQGPGLGLSIARALTDHLGGSLEVDSDVGRGATFTLRLRAAGPVALADPSSIEAG